MDNKEDDTRKESEELIRLKKREEIRQIIFLILILIVIIVLIFALVTLIKNKNEITSNPCQWCFEHHGIPATCTQGIGDSPYKVNWSDILNKSQR